jgi:hypothetical protein
MPLNRQARQERQDLSLSGFTSAFLRALRGKIPLLLAASLSLSHIAHAASPADVSTSALISHAMDSQIPELTEQGGLPDLMKTIESQTGVRIEASQTVWDGLPWGQDTTLNVHARNTTLRQVLDFITRRFGLTYHLGSEAVQLELSPALSRLGQRATLEEIQSLDLLASTPIDLSNEQVTVENLLAAIDGKLRDLKSIYAIQDRISDAATLAKPLHIARNATMMAALEELTNQTEATWYPSGRSLVVTPKIDAVRILLSKKLTRRYDGVPLPQVLVELSEFSGVPFSYAPGVLEKVPAEFRNVKLELDNYTVEETLNTLSGATGLKFTATGDGVDVTYAAPQ